LLPLITPTLRRTRRLAGVDLVGVEPNPGPPKKSKVVRTVKQIIKITKPKSQSTKSNAPISLSRIGSSVGSYLGSAADRVLGTVFGNGSYKVNYNSITRAGGPPQFVNLSKSRSTVVTHREFVQDITGSTGFFSTVFAISPTNATLFPWLALIGQNYEEYRIHGMLFEFKSTSGNSVSSTNTALGTVIMATQYNPNDLPFTSKITMENYEMATSDGPMRSFLHPLECKPALTVAPQLYVSQANAAGTTVDLRLTNFGNFTIATVGMQAANVVGELWVTYQVELIKPRLGSSGTLFNQAFLQYLSSGAITTASINGSLGAANGTFTLFGTATANFIAGATSAANGVSPLVAVPGFQINYGAGISDGFEFPAIFSGHSALVTVSYVGTGIATNSILTSVNTNGANLTVNVISGSFSTTTATLVAQIIFNSLTAPNLAFAINLTSPSATTLSAAVITIAQAT